MSSGFYKKVKKFVVFKLVLTFQAYLSGIISKKTTMEFCCAQGSLKGSPIDR